MITMDQFINGVSNYYEQEFCQKANGIAKFTAYFMMPSIPTLVRNKIEPLRGTPFMDGIMDADGKIDLDAVRDRALNAMTHCGSIDVAGFRLNDSDVNKLYEAIRRA